MELEKSGEGWRGELSRIRQSWQGVDDADLDSMCKEAVRARNVLDVILYLGTGLTVGVAAMRLVGRLRGSDRSSMVGRGVQKFGLMVSVASFFGSAVAHIYAKDAVIELRCRDDERKS